MACVVLLNHAVLILKSLHTLVLHFGIMETPRINVQCNQDCVGLPQLMAHYQINDCRVVIYHLSGDQLVPVIEMSSSFIVC